MSLVLNIGLWYGITENGKRIKHVKGDKIHKDVRQADVDHLVERGLIVDDSSFVDESTIAPESVDEPAEKKEIHYQKVDKTDIKLPAKSAGKQQWDSVAKKLGISTTGLNKSSIIAAVLQEMDK